MQIKYSKKAARVIAIGTAVLLSVTSVGTGLPSFMITSYAEDIDDSILSSTKELPIIDAYFNTCTFTKTVKDDVAIMFSHGSSKFDWTSAHDDMLRIVKDWNTTNSSIAKAYLLLIDDYSDIEADAVDATVAVMWADGKDYTDLKSSVPDLEETLGKDHDIAVLDTGNYVAVTPDLRFNYLCLQGFWKGNSFRGLPQVAATDAIGDYVNELYAYYTEEAKKLSPLSFDAILYEHYNTDVFDLHSADARKDFAIYEAERTESVLLDCTEAELAKAVKKSFETYFEKYKAVVSASTELSAFLEDFYDSHASEFKLSKEKFIELMLNYAGKAGFDIDFEHLSESLAAMPVSKIETALLAQSLYNLSYANKVDTSNQNGYTWYMDTGEEAHFNHGLVRLDSVDAKIQPREEFDFYYFLDRPEMSYISVYITSPSYDIDLNTMFKNRRVVLAGEPEDFGSYDNWNYYDEEPPFYNRYSFYIPVESLKDFSVDKWNDWVQLLKDIASGDAAVDLSEGIINFPFEVDWVAAKTIWSQWKEAQAIYEAEEKAHDELIKSDKSQIDYVYISDDSAYVIFNHYDFEETLFAGSDYLSLSIDDISRDSYTMVKDILPNLRVLDKRLFEEKADEKIGLSDIKFKVSYSDIPDFDLDTFKEWAVAASNGDIKNFPFTLNYDVINATTRMLKDCRMPSSDGVTLNTDFTNLTVYPDDVYEISNGYGTVAYRMPVKYELLENPFEDETLNIDFTKNVGLRTNIKDWYYSIYDEDGTDRSNGYYLDGYYWYQFDNFIPGEYSIAQSNGYTLTEEGVSSNYSGSVPFTMTTYKPLNETATFDPEAIATTTAETTKPTIETAEVAETTSVVETTAAEVTSVAETTVAKTTPATSESKWTDSPKTVETDIDGLVALFSVLATITVGAAGTLVLIKKHK